MKMYVQNKNSYNNNGNVIKSSLTLNFFSILKLNVPINYYQRKTKKKLQFRLNIRAKNQIIRSRYKFDRLCYSSNTIQP